MLNRVMKHAFLGKNYTFQKLIDLLTKKAAFLQKNISFFTRLFINATNKY